MGLRDIAQTVGRVVRDPSRILRLHPSKVWALAHQSLERHEFALFHRAFGVDRLRFEELRRDLLEDSEFQSTIERRYLAIRKRPLRLFARRCAADANPAGRLLYYCVRLLKPESAIDTGVLDGFSTACILKGLRDNEFGHLLSIDLPAYKEVADSSNWMSAGHLPVGQQPGWVIPKALRARWSLRLGSSRDLLPPALEEIGPLDLFYHDSLHTFEHMLWEYRTAWPFLRDGGLLMSDDIFWNRAFWCFSREVNSQRLIKCGTGLIRKHVPLQAPHGRGGAHSPGKRRDMDRNPGISVRLQPLPARMTSAEG